MRFLFITQLIPYPPDHGGKIISFEVLRLLSKYREIHFVSFADDRKDYQKISYLKKYCKSTYVEERPLIYINHPIELLIKFLLSFIVFKPYHVSKCFSIKMKRHIEELIRKEAIETIIVNHETMMQYIPELFKRKVVLIEIDINSKRFEQYSSSTINIIKKILLSIEAQKLKIYEKRVIKRCDFIYAMSSTDKGELIKLGAEEKKILILPIPFKTNYLFRFKSTPSILFIGTMTWKPNFDGINWFLQEIYPRILKIIPDCKLVIAGKGANTIATQSDRYNLVDYIENIQQNSNQINNLYKKTGVFIVPIKIGSGIRIKILDALSKGIPVVTTSLGVQGLPFRHEKEVLIADTNDAFATQVIRVLKNRHFATKLSLNGYNMIKKYYTLDNTISSLRPLLLR